MINGKSHRSSRIGGSDFKKECVIIILTVYYEEKSNFFERRSCGAIPNNFAASILDG